MSPAPRTVRLAASLYPEEAVRQAQTAFVELCSFKCEHLGGDIVLSISPREGAPETSIDEFLTYALSAALEVHLAASA